MSSTSKFRALCFHGFRTNRDILHYQTKKLQLALPEFEFVFLDGFISATGPAEPAVTEFWPDKDVYQWWDAQESGSTMAYADAELSIQRTLSYISENGPFDVLLGFSHGANFITMLTAHCEMLAGGDMRRMPFKAVMLFCSGANSPDQRTFDPIRDGMLLGSTDGRSNISMLQTPSIHIIGQNDSIAAASLALAGAFTSGDSSDNYDSKTYRAVIEGTWGHDFPPAPAKAKRGPRARAPRITMRVSSSRGGKQGSEDPNGEVEGDPYLIIRTCLYKALNESTKPNKQSKIELQPTPISSVLKDTHTSATGSPAFMTKLVLEGGGYLQAKQQLQEKLMRSLVPTEKTWLTSHIKALAKG